MDIKVNEFLNMLKEVKIIDSFSDEKVSVNTHFFSLMSSLGLESEITGAYLKYSVTDYHVFMMNIVCPSYAYAVSKPTFTKTGKISKAKPVESKYPLKRPTKKGEKDFKKVCEIYNPAVLTYAFNSYYQDVEQPRAINTLIESLLNEDDDVIKNYYNEALINLNMYQELIEDEENGQNIIDYTKFKVIKHDVSNFPF